MLAIKSIRENSIKAGWLNKIEKFIKHEVWTTSDKRRDGNNALWRRIEVRLIEMKIRRKRLLLEMFKKESKLKKRKGVEENQFEAEYEWQEG